ncbi:MAG: spore protease YyaC [Syntrophomonadaceae bacterium]|jgi:putative sporulation protein YyaC
MFLYKEHYLQKGARESLTAAVNQIMKRRQAIPAFICIGSDRHILDCFGPLVGTLLKEKRPDLLVYGTLDNPLHAKNLASELQQIKRRHPVRVDIAIDASIGNEEEIGTIKLKEGALFPGRALARKLPAIGDFSLVGIVGTSIDKKSPKTLHYGSIAPVFYMARLISDAVAECCTWL